MINELTSRLENQRKEREDAEEKLAEIRNDFEEELSKFEKIISQINETTVMIKDNQREKIEKNQLLDKMKREIENLESSLNEITSEMKRCKKTRNVLEMKKKR